MAPGALVLVNPVPGVAAFPLWIGGVHVLCRRIFRRTMRKRVRWLDEAVHDIAASIEDAAARAAIAAGDESSFQTSSFLALPRRPEPGLQCRSGGDLTC